MNNRPYSQRCVIVEGGVFESACECVFVWVFVGLFEFVLLMPI